MRIGDAPGVVRPARGWWATMVRDEARHARTLNIMLLATLLCFAQSAGVQRSPWDGQPKPVPTVIARFAQVDLRPPELLPLGGYTERKGRMMSPGGEPLYARALILSLERTRVALVSVEMLTVPDSLVRAVRARLPNDLNLMLCATHTHCAPDSQMLNDRMTFSLVGIASYKHRWLAWYADKIALAVKSAISSRPLSNGYALSAESWQADCNRGRRKGAEPDQTATIVKLGSVPLFFHYAAHGTFYDSEANQTHPDWPGGVTPFAPMAIVGAIGDVSPKAVGLDHASAPAKIQRFWQTMQVNFGHRKVQVALADHLSVRTEPIPLDPRHPHPSFAKTYRVPEGLGQILVEKFAPTEAHITALGLGNVVVVGVPGEPTSHLGRMITEAGLKMGFTDVLVVSHCDGWMGYILDPEDYDAGGYEANLSFYGREEGLKVVVAAINAMRTLRHQGTSAYLE